MITTNWLNTAVRNVALFGGACLLSIGANAAGLHSPLVNAGAGGFDKTAPGNAATGGPEINPHTPADNPLPPSPVKPPSALVAPVSTHVPHNVLGASGLSNHDQRTADGGNQFNLEPPDQALCVGNGFVIEGVNLAFQLRDAASNTPIGNVTSLNKFFGLPSAIDRTAVPVTIGPFTSDPKCVYDVDTRRFFVTALVIATDPATGDFTGGSAVLVAVSKTSDPTQGFAVFSINTTDDGSNGVSNAGCPCFGDQPLIGMDRYGFYVTTNEFPIFQAGFNGAQIYGVSKKQLAAAANGGPIPALAYINAAGTLATPDAGALWYSVQPAMYTPGEYDSEYESHSGSMGGIEYFLSALEFFGNGDTRVAVWAITNTRSLLTSAPNLGIQVATLNTKTFYIGPLSMSQKGSAGLVQSNDDRMNQVFKYGNTLYAGVNTAITDASGATTAGIAYWGVKPTWSQGVLGGSVVVQGTVSVAGNNVVYPSIAVNKDGNGMMAFSLMGPDYYPSAAYIPFKAGRGAVGSVVVVGAGVAPYASFGVVPGVSAGRWGDYSAAADDQGNIWAAAEYVPVTSFGAPSNGGLANWGTYVWRLHPED